MNWIYNQNILFPLRSLMNLHQKLSKIQEKTLYFICLNLSLRIIYFVIAFRRLASASDKK